MDDLGRLAAGKMRIGDVVMLNWDDGGPTRDHLAIVTSDSSGNHRFGHVRTGDARVSQHSNDRLNESWNDTYTPRVSNSKGGGPRWQYRVLRPRWKVANP